MQAGIRHNSSHPKLSPIIADQHIGAAQQDSGDEDGNPLSGDDRTDGEGDDLAEVVRSGKRKRPISVSCELCKQRKVKCDRGQPSCGWCSRNGAICEYKERKKPGLRAGYGRELEQRLDKLESILRAHSEILQASMDANHHHNTSPGGFPHPNASASVRGSNASLPSDHGTPRETAPPMFPRPPDNIRTPQAETALFLQKPSSSYSAVPQQPQGGMEFGLPPQTPSMLDGFPQQVGISPPSHGGMPSAAAQEYYGTGASSSGAGSTTHAGSGRAGDLHSPSSSTLMQSQAQISSDHDLPPYDLLYALVDLYFKHINTWCPILHRKTTIDSLFTPSSAIEEADKILLHAIVATTLRYSTDSRLTDESRQRYHDVSKKRVLLYGMENSSVKALQALVILALDLCGSSNGPPGWNIMALITRSVVQLGLAVETNSFSVSPNYTSIYTLRAMMLPEPRDFIEEESRRRLFWMVYLLDRYATISTAFEFALDDREIDRTLPCRDDLWIKNQKVETRWFRGASQRHHFNPHGHHHEDSGSVTGPADGPGEYGANKPENLGAFSYYIEILTVLSQIHNFLKLPVDISALSDVENWQMRYKELDNTLTSWKFGLPGEYGNMAKLFHPPAAKSLSCGWVMLHATFHTAVIRLHSSAAYPTTRSPIFTPSYSASQRCHGAVENIAALGEFVLANGMLAKLGPPFAFTLWVAARVLLVHGSTVEHKVSPQINFFVDALREMGRYWPVAGRYCELLQRVLDEYRDSAHQGESFTPSSVKILADMRRTAFDLDFLISRQPHHTPGGGNGGFSTGAMGEGGVGGLGVGNGGVAGGAGGSMSRYPSITPARTPQPNELEYLDVFDFFNYPRLPFGASSGGGDLPAPAGTNGNGNMNGNGARGISINNHNNNTGMSSASGSGGGNGNPKSAAAGGSGDGGSGGGAGEGSGGGGGGNGGNGGGGALSGPNEFNITDFMVDINRDWLFKQEGSGSKFVT